MFIFTIAGYMSLQVVVLELSKSGKYRTAQRIQFLKQKKYIENYKISSLCKNSLETVYLISAPTELHKKLITQSLI